MIFVSFNVDCGDRTCGAHMFASATANAFRFINTWHHGRVLVILVELNHGDGTGGAVARAVATRHWSAILGLVACGDAQEVCPHGSTNLGRCLLLQCDGLDGSGGAHLRAAVALGTAVATFIAHDGLHEGEQIACTGL